MPKSGIRIWTQLRWILKIFLVVLVLQSCKSYHSASMSEVTTRNESNTAIKITKQNGDQFLYENIEILDGQYYGVYVENEEEIKIPLEEAEIKSVQIQSEKASLISKILGISAVVGALIFAGTMM